MPASRPRWTVKYLAESIAPEWAFPSDWLFWPPDVFALTSILLRQTGCYRHIISPDWPREAGWQPRAERCAMAWLEGISALLARGAPEGADGPLWRLTPDVPAPLEPVAEAPFLLDALAEIEELAPVVTVEQLRVLATPEAKRLCRNLVIAHCVADEACTGFGLLVAPATEHALAHCLANLLLTARGSLSAVSKHHGIVLPKMRTPQSGLTLRSVSHQVTFHSSEVEVMWRTVPWANIEENTINILMVPWPAEVEENTFYPLRDTFESVRYFRYDPPGEDSHARLDGVVRLVRQVNEEVGRLHMLVFPELALTKAEYEALMWKLRDARREGRIEHVPLLITGIHNRDPVFGDLNEVRLAVYFAQSWYELSQRKHHRWKIDRNQILQYCLEGRFATTRNWYEMIPVAQRRLTFLTPTGWLALCPLICEDLAQLEPVSELIRGVGPTLLTALLMDGPQLKHRWAARYASVFADDPGTAVLSLTCAGMSCRSRSLEDPDSEERKRTVALWKDQITGWKILDLKDGCGALLMTISADWTEEWTVDGRGDHQNASVFKFEGVRQYPLPGGAAAGGDGAEAGPTAQDAMRESGDRWLRDWADIRELSAATFGLDAIISLRGRHVEQISGWVLSRPAPEEEEALPARLRELIDLLRESQRDPSTVGVEAVETNWPTPQLQWAAREIRTWFAEPAATDSATAYWSELAGQAIRQLRSDTPWRDPATDLIDDADRQRLGRAIPLAILSALHSRIEKGRRRRPLPHGGVRQPGASLPNPRVLVEMAELLDRIEEALREYA
ncbi:MAG TPA: hypothetical protein VF746_19600 [Longimicrobium sp.]